MKKFLSVLISILFTLALLFTLLLGVVRTKLSYSSIIETATKLFTQVSAAQKLEYEDDGLFHPESLLLSYADYEISDFDINSLDLGAIDFTNMDINQIVQSYLDEADVDVPPELVNEILSSPELSETIDKYAGEVISYVTGQSEELNIDTEDFTKLVNTAIDKYEESTGEVVDRTGLDEAVVSNVEAMVPEITASLDEAKEENQESLQALKWVDFLLSAKCFAYAIGLCLLLILFIVLLNLKSLASLSYISIPAIIDGILIFIGSLLAASLVPGLLQGMLEGYNLPAGTYELIWDYVLVIIKALKLCSYITVILGVAVLVLRISLKKKAAENNRTIHND